MLAGTVPEAIGNVFNIGANQETTITALAELVRDLVGSDSDIVLLPYQNVFGEWFEDTPRRVPDIRRAVETLGFRAETPIEDGLKATIAWFRQTWTGNG
jgi:UDP-glucose 4-epimerase